MWVTVKSVKLKMSDTSRLVVYVGQPVFILHFVTKTINYDTEKWFVNKSLIYITRKNYFFSDRAIKMCEP